jgi:hypothetical protein
MKEIDVSLIENGQMREFIALPNHVRPLRGRFVLLIILPICDPYRVGR